jgi:outer membrane receptor protein involved in Fe transport
MLRRKVLSLATALTSLVAPGLAVAQDVTTPPPAPPPAAEPAPATPAAAEAKEEKTEEITITGTRIRRKDLGTPAPVTVINREQITASGKVSIGDFLQALPEQGNAINTGVNNGGDGATRVNLRGVGAARTLVLVNGRRWMPGGTGADSSADLNSIPTAVIERIEVLKDGASAVYGSDAIAGVVNIITRKGGAKTDVSAFTGTSGQGDGTTFDLNLTTGASGDRGSVLFSAGYYDQRKVMAGDRSFGEIPYFYDATGDNNAFGHFGKYSSGSSASPQGLVLAGDDAATPTDPLGNLLLSEGLLFWDPEGTCGPTASGSPTCFRPFAGGGLRDAGDPGDGYNYAPENYLITPQQRISLFSTGDLQLGAGARGFFEASYVNRQSGQDLAPEPLFSDIEGVLVSKDSIYNPFGLDVYSRRRLVEFGRRQFRQDLDTFRVLLGVDGSLPESVGPLAGWFWDVNFNWGRTEGVSTKRGNLYLPALQAAMGPSMMVGGVPTCVAVAGDASSAIPGCVPLNLFGGPGSITPDMISGLTFNGTSRGTNQLTAFQANTSGEIFRLMSDRPVGLAVGYEFRDVAGSFINDPITAKGLTTGNKGLDTKGSYNVNEVYGELSIPIVSGMELVEDLEATAAVRWFDYSNFGSDSTYKFGARYRPIRDLTVRGTYSTAFRAPSISDLYLGRSDNFPSVKDPCRGMAQGGQPVTPGTTLGDICMAQGVPEGGNGDTQSQLRSQVGGNDKLGPETADIFTVGVVIEPRMVKNLSLTVDYFNIDIEDNISSIGENVILAGCYSGSNPAYCDLIQRNPATDLISNILNLNANVGRLQTAGIDFAIRYALPTAAYGRFGFAFDASWLQKIDQTLADGTVVKGRNTFDLNTLNSFGQAGGTFPSFKFNAGVNWGFKGLSAGVNTRFLGPFEECGDENGDFAGSGLCYADSTFARRVDAYHTEDVFVAYTAGSFAGRTNVMVGVQNLFDADPAKIYNGFASQTDQYNYDQLGRFFYVRLAHTY